MKKILGVTAILLMQILVSAGTIEVVTVDVKKKPYDKKWTPRQTTVIGDELDRSVSQTIGYTRYGGVTQLNSTKTGFFNVKKIGGKWILLDPDGGHFISKGINSVRIGKTDGSLKVFEDLFGDDLGWANQTAQELREAGFNTIGSWSDWQLLRKADDPVPYTIIWNFMSSYGRSIGGVHQQSGHVGYPNDCIFVFNKGFEEFCDDYAKQQVGMSDDPYLIGHFSDNEMPLKLGMLDRYLELDTDEEGYQAAVTWLKKKGVKPSQISDATRADFLEHVAERYFGIVNRAIKKHDPNHLYLGCRFYGSSLRLEPLFKAAGRHLDIISVNWYGAWSPDQERMDNWMKWSGRPFIITEFYAKGMDSGMGNTSGAGWTVKTQRERGYFYQNFTLGLLEHPNCVGWHWHRYMDNDPNAGEDPSNVDSNKGIVTCEYVPHADLIREMRKLNYHADTGSQANAGLTIIPFGEGGQLKMIYDRRQRPQAIYMKDQVYMVYNAGAHLFEGKGKKTVPFVISYDPMTMTLGKEIQLGFDPDSDQHYCPIIWSDKNEHLHILYGCHRTPGTHLISKEKGSLGESLEDWTEGPMIRDSLSYPTIFHVLDDKQLMYFRTGEHRSSWGYRISDDNGESWIKDRIVTDLNSGDELNTHKAPMDMDEMSCYQTVLPSEDGKYLHVVFCVYDDNKKNLPEKFYNPRYKTEKNFSFKYNLYYVKVNLQTQKVVNFEGEPLRTPIDMETADSKCMIWDTDWRGAGVPPDIILDNDGNPAFLHVLSGDTPNTYNYWFVRYADGEWKQTLIAPSSDDWNSCYLRQEDDGTLYACMVMGEPFFDGLNQENSNDMHSRGGGDIEEWISTDKGQTWAKHRDLTPRAPEFAGWKFNNVQPIKDVDEAVVPGMYLFYGWKDPDARTARAFLVIDESFKSTARVGKGQNSTMSENPLIRALELDKAGDWDAAHTIAQDIHTKDGSWLHAYLHRVEGDLGNAAYWYSRAGKAVAEDSLEEEWKRLYSAFKTN